MEAPRPPLTLEVTIISADNLRMDRTTETDNAYVVIRAESLTSVATSTVAPEYSGGDNNNNNKFSWKNDKSLVVEIPKHARCVTLEVKSKVAAATKSVGVARMAVSEFVGGGGSVKSYRVRDWEGRPSGVVNFLVRILEHSSSSSSSSSSSCNCDCNSMVMMKSNKSLKMEKVSSSSCGGEMMRGVVVGEKISCNNGGVVVGVPVWWNYYTMSHF